jgi:DNA-binding NarL/FixJ family response regulator
MNIRILLAENHELMRTTIWDLLDNHPGMEVLAAVDSSHSAVSLSRQLKPNVVVLNINMPDLKGTSAISRIVCASTAPKLLALSLYPNRQYVKRVMAAGASGYLLKDSVHEEMFCAIRTVACDQIYLSTKLEMPKYLQWFNYNKTPDFIHHL